MLIMKFREEIHVMTSFNKYIHDQSALSQMNIMCTYHTIFKFLNVSKHMSHPVDVLLATVVDGVTSTPEVVAVDEARSTKLWRLLNKMGELGLCSGLLLVLLTLELELSLDGEGAVGPIALKVGGSNGILPAKKVDKNLD